MKKLLTLLSLLMLLSVSFAANPTNLPVGYNATTRVINPTNLLGSNIVAGAAISTVQDSVGRVTVAVITNGFNMVIARSGTSIWASNNETIIFTNNLPANCLGTNRTAHLVLDCQILNNTAGSSNFTVKVWFGSSVVFQHVTVSLANNSAIRETLFDVRAKNLDSTASQAIRILFLSSINTSVPTVGTGGLNGAATTAFPGAGLGGGVATFDTTTTTPFAVTITPSATAPALFYLRMVSATLTLE